MAKKYKSCTIKESSATEENAGHISVDPKLINLYDISVEKKKPSSAKGIYLQANDPLIAAKKTSSEISGVKDSEGNFYFQAVEPTKASIHW